MRQADLIVATGGAGHGARPPTARAPRRTASASATRCTSSTRPPTSTTRRPMIAVAKTFDYATSCLADNSVVAHDRRLRRAPATGSPPRGGYLCTAEEKAALQRAMWPDGGAHPDHRGRGQAGGATSRGWPGSTVPTDRTFLDRRGGRHRAGASVLGGEAVRRARALPVRRGDRAGRRPSSTTSPAYQGLGHTCGIHTSVRRPRRHAGLGDQDRPRAGQPEPQRGRGQPPQRPAVHAQPELRHLGRQHHHRERQRPALRQPDLGGPADRPRKRSSEEDLFAEHWQRTAAEASTPRSERG